ncbi:MAG: hypothetical protein B7733_07560 [Myxococcales bacterium FL481]|nr:MAG: hypothetical protein B7733_07560 [Myxococcales bacterium FL481]
MRRFATLVTSSLVVGACVMGVRGEHLFKEIVPAPQLRSLTIDLPPTALRVEGVEGAVAIGYEGAWYSTAGTEKDARANAAQPKILVNYNSAGAGEIVAHVPLQVENLVDLELHRMLISDRLDVEVVGRYTDIEMYGIEGYHYIDVDAGRVEVKGADRGAFVKTRTGDVVVHSSGPISAETAIGDVEIEQTGPSVDVFARTRAGELTVTLPRLDNVALEITTSGRVDIRSRALVKVSDGDFEQILGDGSVLVELHASGDVSIFDTAWLED